MAKPIPNLRFTGLDDNGKPLVGGLLYTYIAGTTTPLGTYSDPAGTVPNTNPIVLDGGGRAPVFLGARNYKFVLHDALDVPIYTQDNIDGSETAQNITNPWADHAVTDGQAAANLSGETVDGATYQAAIYDVKIVRGTTVFAIGTVWLQYQNSTWAAVPGIFSAAHGVTFSVSQSTTVGTLQAALDSGAGNGTISLSRRLVPA